MPPKNFALTPFHLWIICEILFVQLVHYHNISGAWLTIVVIAQSNKIFKTEEIQRSALKQGLVNLSNMDYRDNYKIDTNRYIFKNFVSNL